MPKLIFDKRTKIQRPQRIIADIETDVFTEKEKRREKKTAR